MDRYAGLPPLPDRINRLDQLAIDLWWSWNAEGRDVSSAASTTRCGARPRTTRCACCGWSPRAKIEAAADDPEFLAALRRGDRRRSNRRAPRTTPGGRTSTRTLQGQSIAYFSAEFALHQSLPIYAGGLGVLAGDHCKEASDLGVPLIGIGFMYPQGYFHQHVSAEGWQEESYERLNWADAAIERATDARRQAVHHRGAARRTDGARAVWRVRLGRVHAVSARHRSRRERAVGPRTVGAALRRRSRDAHPAGNHPRHRRRPRAEGARLGPGVFHLNEGHAGFVVLQRIRDLIERGRQLRRRARGNPADDGLHDAHAGAGRPRRVRVSPGRKASRRLLGHARRRIAIGSSRSAAYDNGGGPQFNMTALGAPLGRQGERRQRTARPGDARDVGADVAGRAGGGAAGRLRSPTACTCRPGSPRDLADLFARYLGTDWLERHDDPALWDARARRFPMRSSGPCGRRCAAICSPSSASARASAGRSSTSARRASSPPARCSTPKR